MKPFVLGKEEMQTTTIGAGLELNDECNLAELLRANADLFAWGAADMLRIHPIIITHKLSIFKEVHRLLRRNRDLAKKKGTSYKRRSLSCSKLNSSGK